MKYALPDYLYMDVCSGQIFTVNQTKFLWSAITAQIPCVYISAGNKWTFVLMHIVLQKHFFDKPML